MKRTVNSGTKYYIERISKEFQHTDIYNSSASIDNKPVYSDCAKLVILGSAGKTFTGFSYLEGQTVACVADGSYVGTKVVASGSIVLTDNATELIAGLPYSQQVVTLPIEAGAIIGSAMGAVKRIDRIVMNFVRSIGAKFGKSTDAADLITVNMRDSNTVAADDPTPLFTGQKRDDFTGEYEGDSKVAFVQDNPLPMSISGFSVKGITYD